MLNERFTCKWEAETRQINANHSVNVFHITRRKTVELEMRKTRHEARHVGKKVSNKTRQSVKIDNDA